MENNCPIGWKINSGPVNLPFVKFNIEYNTIIPLQKICQVQL